MPESVSYPTFSIPYGIISPAQTVHGDVSELADEHDLGSCAERREGSIPSVPTIMDCHCEGAGPKQSPDSYKIS